TLSLHDGSSDLLMEGQLLGRLRFLAEVFCQGLRVWCSRHLPSRKVGVGHPDVMQTLFARGMLTSNVVPATAGELHPGAAGQVSGPGWILAWQPGPLTLLDLIST